MGAIERENPTLKGVLPRDYARPSLDKVRLGGLVDIISNIGFNESAAKSKDVLGRVYQFVEIRVTFQIRNFSWVKFSKSSVETAVTAVPTRAEIRPVGLRNAARSARAGLFARSLAAFQAAASRAMRSRL